MTPEEKPFRPIWKDREKWYVRTDEVGVRMLTLVSPVTQRAKFFILEVGKAFPNVFKMLDLAVNFFTGFPGLILTTYLIAQKQAFLRELKAQKLDARLIRLDDAVDGFFNTFILGVKQVSFTSETGLIVYLLGRFGMGVYRFFKRWRLLAKLLKAKDEIEFVNTILTAYKRRLTLIGVVAIPIALTAWLIAVGFAMLCLVFSVNFGEIYAYLLPQDSKRVRGLRKHTQYRVNLRKGSDL